MGNFKRVFKRASQRSCRLSRSPARGAFAASEPGSGARRRVSGGGRGRQGAPCPSGRRPRSPDGRGRRRRLRSSVPAVSARHCPSDAHRVPLPYKTLFTGKFSSPEDCKGTWNKSFLKKMKGFKDGIMKLRKWQKVVEEDGEDTTQ